MKKINIAGFEIIKLKKLLKILNVNYFHGIQILKWIHKKGVCNFILMSNISKLVKYKLFNLCIIKFPIIEKEEISSDGTIKWLFKISKNNYIESVYMLEENRITLCLSSQIGCVLNCSFCNTGKHGFNRNLYSSEIVGQLYVIKKRLYYLYINNIIFSFNEISNIVIMGMGEPLLNFNNLSSFLLLIRNNSFYNISKKHIIISSAGIIPGIHDLYIYNDVSLAISLHATNDLLRTKLMPINKKYNINMLFKFFCLYKNVLFDAKITIEYIMLKGINDYNYYAYKLIKLLNDDIYKINLIQFNIIKNVNYVSSLMERIYCFQNILKQGGLIVTIRKIKGLDINASCGQLFGKFVNKKI
ncbi:MAG: 23S rRNA (adenine(2503)-C(2))-methyltransferase RlmN [Candidatus Azosocius agrarius]|nr:MAG: 23S rRNA (adenine(2503)-C(2))-methyltransferase RlmN [Gammaproteobacteria bacterium]